MRRVAASAIAMAAGWVVMNAALFIVALVTGWIPLQATAFIREVEGYLWWLAATAIVVVIAGAAVYLPVYAWVPRRSRFWDWRVCVPAGAVAGAAIPFVFLILMAEAPRITPGDLLYLLMPATVGVVAAVVGRYLLDWSRNYRELGEAGPQTGEIIQT